MKIGASSHRSGSPAVFDKTDFDPGRWEVGYEVYSSEFGVGKILKLHHPVRNQRVQGKVTVDFGKGRVETRACTAFKPVLTLPMLLIASGVDASVREEILRDPGVVPDVPRNKARGVPDNYFSWTNDRFRRRHIAPPYSLPSVLRDVKEKGAKLDRNELRQLVHEIEASRFADKAIGHAPGLTYKTVGNIRKGMGTKRITAHHVRMSIIDNALQGTLRRVFIPPKERAELRNGIALRRRMGWSYAVIGLAAKVRHTTVRAAHVEKRGIETYVSTAIWTGLDKLDHCSRPLPPVGLSRKDLEALEARLNELPMAEKMPLIPLFAEAVTQLMTLAERKYGRGGVARKGVERPPWELSYRWEGSPRLATARAVIEYLKERSTGR
ncbi:MAG: hypothetical protein ACKVPX_00645 [Myxococcaceae bacterium]